MKFELNINNKHLLVFVVTVVVVIGLSTGFAEPPNPGHSWEQIEIPVGVWTGLTAESAVNADYATTAGSADSATIAYDLSCATPPCVDSTEINSTGLNADTLDGKDWNNLVLECVTKSTEFSWFTTTVTCDEGYTVTGGGVWVYDPGLYTYTMSRPVENGWECGSNEDGTCYAVCCRIT